ncbi:unnamed protein product [Cuscuta campestris]|uniref:DYW domain-containing protein n=1 Tax=Cuscuta campestris TaxID=132261 RepID=A0A484KXJ1_9ASTE|nr:unnamed protein product [Cuscuta campestris]
MLKLSFKCSIPSSEPAGVGLFRPLLSSIIELGFLFQRSVSYSFSTAAKFPEGSSADDALIGKLAAYSYQRDLPRAMDALYAMERHKIWANAVIYTELIKCCVAQRAVEHGKHVHQHVFSNGYEPKTFLLNAILNMYVKFNMLGEAQALFDQMPERNVVAWSTIISAYSSSNLNFKALKLLILMLRDGVQPNMYTYSSVLRSCDAISNLTPLHCSIIKVGLDSDVFVRSALIDVYAKMGRPNSALDIFDEMKTHDRVVWNSIIGGFAQNSDGYEALTLYIRMKRAGFPADQSTLTSSLRACTSLALLEVGRQFHVQVLKFHPDLILHNALLDMYCKCGSVDDANRTFTQMAERDVISWSTMLMGLAQNGFSKEALDLFEEMKSHGRVKPNRITVLGVLFACSHAGMVEEGQYYFRSMKKLFGIDPGTEHYGCMVDLLGRAGKLDEAVKLIHEMECEPDTVTWRTLLGACRLHRNMDLAEYAVKQIINIDPSDAGTYILLSNIYARTQKWEEASNVRRTMRSKGVKKEPGCSWIEVNKQIHAFILGDKSHPQINEIEKELNKIISRLREVGYVPDTNFVLQDLEGEQMEDSLLCHSEKLAIAYGLMSLPKEKTIRVRKNLRICGDCHLFAKLLTKLERRTVVIRDPIRYHHFQDGVCSCSDYW